MKYEIGDLVKYAGHFGRPASIHRLMIDSPERHRLAAAKAKTIGIVLRTIEPHLAWDNARINDPNCYIVFWCGTKTKSLVYEDELK